jgi:hypothetical protein
MAKISDKNIIIQFLSTYRTIVSNSSKMVIALEGRPVRTSPFRVFHTSLEPIKHPGLKLKSSLSLEKIPSLVSVLSG